MSVRMADGHQVLHHHQISSSPVELALGLVYLVVVYARVAATHVPLVVELPQLVPVRAPPLAFPVVRLVLEPDRDAVLRKAPKVLLEPVVELPELPAREEGVEEKAVCYARPS